LGGIFAFGLIQFDPVGLMRICGFEDGFVWQKWFFHSSLFLEYHRQQRRHHLTQPPPLQAFQLVHGAILLSVQHCLIAHDLFQNLERRQPRRRLMRLPIFL
jgi:hypothetical protein